MEARRVACERTSRFVSLDLDGELSRFERALLVRHLARCDRCAAEADMIVGLTQSLRAAPLEPLPAPIVVLGRRRRTRSRVTRSALAMASLAAVGIWFGVTVAGHTTAPGIGVTPGTSTGTAAVAASDGRSDWPAGLPRSPQMIRLVPGGLYTSGSQF
jgi:anti-sigma factor RsiW